VLKVVEKYLRIDDRMSAADIMRARAVYITSFVVFLTQVANQLSMHFIQNGNSFAQAISLIACCSVLSLCMALRFTKNFKALTIGFVAVLFLGVITSALPMGRLGLADGVNSSMLPILICGTILCAIMYNWYAPLLFCIPAFVTIWTFYGLSMNYTQPHIVITEELAMMQYVRAFQTTLALFVSGIITSYFSFRMYNLFSKLENSAQTARQAEDMTSLYLANISHEIRTPLNGIIGMSNLLAKAPMGEKDRGYANIIKDCSEGLLCVINDVLDLSKLDAGKFSLSALPFDLQKLCQDLSVLHGSAAEKKGLAMQFIYDASTPTHLIGDTGRLRQVLNNLLSNAVKFTDNGAIALRVQGQPDGERDFALQIYVRDTGHGIPADELPKVFNRFEQADNSSRYKASPQGSGLGLSISKELIEHMGGTIRVNSEPGKGTIFGVFVTLPIA